MNNLLWKTIGKPLAALGGRSFDEMRERTAPECDKSILVGMLTILSVAVIFAGHWLFWSNLTHTADIALPLAAGIALVLAVMYRVALRGMETIGAFGKALLLGCLAGLMLVNALLAGHELVLFAFKPQVDAQARLRAANGVTTYGSAVESSLGLPDLRTHSADLDKAVAAARIERERVPDVVTQFQRQAQSCEATATRLHARIPDDPEDPGHAAAISAWREQRARCRALTSQASQALARHRAEADRELADLTPARERARRSLELATTRREETLARDAPTLTASATTGFARHPALWAAVEAGTVPMWGAVGLMFLVLVADGFSFLVKLLLRDDAVTTERVQASDTALLYSQLHARMVHQQRRMASQVVRSMNSKLFEDVEQAARQMVAPTVMQAMDERAFATASAAYERARKTTGAPSPSMLARIATMARTMRERATASPAAASA